jgi:hypothetical protein
MPGKSSRDVSASEAYPFGYDVTWKAMSKTVHVYRSGNGWTVKREGAKAAGIFRPQKEALESAHAIVRDSASSQMIVHGKDGRLKEHVTHGLPKVRNPPHRSRNSTRIEKAVGKHALERVRAV